MNYRNVILVGPTGFVGASVMRALTSESNRKSFDKLAVLAPSGYKSNEELAQAYAKIEKDGFEIREAVLDDFTSLVRVFHGIDVVVSTIDSSDIRRQAPIIDAAVASGVRRFYPAEYGFKTDEPQAEGQQLVVDKRNIRLKLQAVASRNPGFSWTIIFAGILSDWLLQQKRNEFELDTEGRSVVVVGSADVPNGWIHNDDVGAYVVATLQMPPDESKNRVFRFATESLSWKDVTEVLQKVQGGKPYTIQEWESEDALVEEYELRAEGRESTANDLNLRRILGSTDMGCLNPTDNKLFPQIKPLTFEQTARSILKAQASESPDPKLSA